MKNRYIILMGLLLLIMAVGCEQDYTAPNSFNDVAWYTNKKNGVDYKVKAGDHMSFMDMSQNAISHMWTIEEGNKFLMTGFTGSEDLTTFIDPDKDLSTEDLTVHVLFQNSGLNKVRLYNTFDSKVTYRGDVDFEAVKIGDEWVIDTSFVVDVYGTLLPAFKVYKIIDDTLGKIISEEEILHITETDFVNIKDSASWPLIELEAGSRLKLVDLTQEDRPNAREWSINNQNPAAIYTDSVSTVYFNSLDYIAGIGSLKSQRKQDVGDDTPTASASKLIPLKVNVVKSSKPFIAVGDFAEIEGKEAISFFVSGEVETIVDGADAFTVHVNNAMTGFNADIPVLSVKKNSEDASLVELVLSDSIYGNDVVTVSFDNTQGSLTSVDGRVLNSFDTQVVEMAMKGENIMLGSDGDVLNWVGYEETTNANTKNGFMVAESGTGAWWSGAPAFYKSEDISFSGNASLKFAGDATVENNLWHMNVTDAVEFPAGSYIIRQKIYIKGGSDIKVVSNDMADKSSSFAIVMDLNWDVETLERDKWIEIETTAELSAPLLNASGARWGYYVRPSLNDGVSASQTFYLDDLEIISVESRP